MNDYQIVNSFLNEYAKDIEDSLYTKYIETCQYLLIKTDDIIQKSPLNTQEDPLKNEPSYSKKASLSGLESVELVRDFIKEESPAYLEKFDIFLQNGTINLQDKEDDWPFSPPSGDYIRTIDSEKDKIWLMNTALEHNYQDPIKIIHEFFHLQNCTGEDWINIRLFTEAISIYYETRLCRYMEKRNYEIEEIMKVQRFRIKDVMDTYRIAIMEALFLESYQKLGDISDETWTDRYRYNMPVKWMKEQDFKTDLHLFSRVIKENKSDPIKHFSYVAGTLIAYNAIHRSDGEQRITELNNALATDQEIAPILQKWGLTDSIQPLFATLETELQRIHTISTLQKWGLTDSIESLSPPSEIELQRPHKNGMKENPLRK